MTTEGYRGPIPPEYDLAVYDDEAIIKILAKIIQAKRDFASAYTRITGPIYGHRGSSVGAASDSTELIDRLLRPYLEDSIRAGGMIQALDVLAPLRGGRRWNDVSNEIVDNPDIVFPPQTT